MRASIGIRVGPIARLSFGIVALLVSLVLLADMLLGVVPAHGQSERLVRQRIAESLAAQITPLLEAGDSSTLGKTIQSVLARDAEIRSITVRRNDGSALVQRGQAPQAKQRVPTAASTDEQLRVPILAGRQPWGEVELRFAAAKPPTLRDWLDQPGIQLLLVLGLGGFGLTYAYLRRAMQYLNPSASVPDRVRKAFDTLAEGLLVVNQQSCIVLANRAFRHLHPQAEGDLNGQHIESLGWLTEGAGRTSGAPAPWLQTLKNGTSVSGQPLELRQLDGSAIQLLVSSAAITDNKGRARGCMITFDNVTAVHRANEELRDAVAKLESSRQRIEEQNEELRRLATRDPLTGCYNRRAFFELAVEAFTQRRRGQAGLCCLMVDIDHFKQFNDVHGHAVGDQVIQVVARQLTAGLRPGDFLGRYGGEEFCIVLPGATPQEALAVAERMRADIEANARDAIRGVEVMPLAASFGVASLSPGVRSVEALIEQADQALYHSKQTGRNRVTLWERATAPMASPVGDRDPGGERPGSAAPREDEALQA
jgi:diguanylate cyclase (GGDEF)-like protein/PAS domain S-box-containing protein